jgi:MarR family transcriptional regulator, 2-MHQ and catechol-resistance regulon repressor
VRRERDARDRRVMQVSLTPVGQTLITDIMPTHAQSIEAVFGALSPEEMVTLARLARKLGLSLRE